MKNYLVVILVLFVVILTGTTFYFWRESQKNVIVENNEIEDNNKIVENKEEIVKEKEVESELPEGSFKKTEIGSEDFIYEGDFYLKGYIIKKFEESRSGEKLERVYFHVTSYGKKNEFKDQFGFDLDFNKEKGYLLGCLEKSMIFHDLLYDDIAKRKYIFESGSLLKSSENNQIILHVKANVSSTGMGAPECYSVFNRNIEVYKK